MVKGLLPHSEERGEGNGEGLPPPHSVEREGGGFESLRVHPRIVERERREGGEVEEHTSALRKYIKTASKIPVHVQQ